MKIAIDSRSVNLHSGTGIGTYTENVISEMININKDDNFTLIWTGEIAEKFKKDNVDFLYSSGRHGRFFENIYIPNKLNDKSIDLYIFPPHDSFCSIPKILNGCIFILTSFHKSF